MIKVLIIDDMHASIVPGLEAIGHIAHYRPDIKRAEILEIIHQYQGLLVRSKTAIDQELINTGRQLQFIGRAGAGLDQIDVEATQKREIHLINAPEGNRDTLGEHTVGLLLSLLNKIHTADLEIRSGQWHREANRGIEIMNKTIGLFGYGNMAQAFAKRLSGFGCKVIAYDKYNTAFKNDYAQSVSESELHNLADIVSIHVPLTEETRAYFTIDYLNKFKKSIFLINTARGEIVPFQDLLAGLASGKIRGAGLDVLENEKLSQLTPSQQISFDAICQLPNVVFSPHVAGWSVESYERINRVLIEKIKELNLIEG